MEQQCVPGVRLGEVMTLLHLRERVKARRMGAVGLETGPTCWKYESCLQT